MQHIYYIKTPAGVAAMSERARDLTPRQRQIMLMCSGKRPLSVLIELFGDSVVRELHELVAPGYLRALRLVGPSADSAVDPDAGTGLDDTLAAHAKAAGLQLARNFTTTVLMSLDTAEADALVVDHGMDASAEGVLAYAAALLGLLFRAGDIARAERVGYKLADLLPRDLVPLFVDGMLDGQDPQFAAALYEHLLSDRELPRPN